mmetsp:Transcript_89204/g.239022  ORF Transcript_89204/g.239022 Transcript_89204/m.239022 type:complete len:314 (-) Transcript_89204:222-1163(-)
MVTRRHHDRILQQSTLPHALNHLPHHPVRVPHRVVILLLPILRPAGPSDLGVVPLEILGDYVRVVRPAGEDGHKHGGLGLLSVDPVECLLQGLLIPRPPGRQLVLLLPLPGRRGAVKKLLDPELLPEQVQLLEAQPPGGEQRSTVPRGVEELGDGHAAEGVGDLVENGPLGAGVPARYHGQNSTQRGRKGGVHPRESHRLGLQARQDRRAGGIHYPVRGQHVESADTLVEKQKHVGLRSTEAGEECVQVGLLEHKPAVLNRSVPTPDSPLFPAWKNQQVLQRMLMSGANPERLPGRAGPQRCQIDRRYPPRRT